MLIVVVTFKMLINLLNKISTLYYLKLYNKSMYYMSNKMSSLGYAFFCMHSTTY